MRVGGRIVLLVAFYERPGMGIDSVGELLTSPVMVLISGSFPVLESF
jgi:hypothetical protein